MSIPNPTDAGNGVEAKPCDVVALRGYLREGRFEGYSSLYKDRTLRRWTAIPQGAIEGQSSTEDEEKQGLTVVYVNRNATAIECEAVLVSSYDVQSQSAMRSVDEDLGALKWPR